MDVLQKLQSEAKRLDLEIKFSLTSKLGYGNADRYDIATVDMRELLEAAVKEIAHVRLERDLAMSAAIGGLAPIGYTPTGFRLGGIARA